MIGFQEVGFIIRLVSVYGFNLKRMNRQNKINNDRETIRDAWAGILFFVLVILSILYYQ